LYKFYNFSVFVDHSIDYGASVVKDSFFVVALAAARDGPDLLLLHHRNLGNLRRERWLKLFTHGLVTPAENDARIVIRVHSLLFLDFVLKELESVLRV